MAVGPKPPGMNRLKAMSKLRVNENNLGCRHPVVLRVLPVIVVVVVIVFIVIDI